MNRWVLLSLRGIALGGFVLAILGGIAGTPVGNHNLAIIAVWIAWWAALILIIVPFLGRGWCAICPIPMPGEWLQHGTLLGPLPGGKTTQRQRRRFPRIIRNIWLQNIGFTLLALFSAVILTRPAVTGWVLLGMLLLATGISQIFERRAFCRYLCPVGGFIGLYAQLAPLELRVIDPQLCKAHKTKSCFQGSAAGYGCPWNVFPASMTVNTNCGLCMECLHTCEYGNIGLNLRAFGADIQPQNRIGMDEAYKAFIMLGSALTYAAVYLGPWGWLKTAAYGIGSLPWVVFAASFLIFTWIILPGLFYLAAYVANKKEGTTEKPIQAFKAYAASLLPLGLAAWVAFSLSFIFTSISYLWPVLSDPFGWGWNLFGTTNIPWTPYLGSLVPYLQVGALLGGFVWSGFYIRKNIGTQQSVQPAAPVVGFNAAIVMVFLWLLIA